MSDAQDAEERAELGADRSLLLVDDDEPFVKRLARAMEKRGFVPETAESVAAGKAIAGSRPPAYAVVDLRLEDGNGLDVVEMLRDKRPDCRIVVLTGYGAIAPAVAQLFHLPVRHGLLVSAVCRASGAAKAGIHAATEEVTLAGNTWPLGGDIIVKADGVGLASLERLRSLVDQKQPGDSVQLEIVRGEKTMSVQVKLGRQPLSARC